MSMLKYRTSAQRINGQHQLITFTSTDMESAIKAAVGFAGARDVKDMQVLELHEYHPDGTVKMLDVMTNTLVVGEGKGTPAKDEPVIDRTKSVEEVVQETIDKAIEQDKKYQESKQLALIPKESLAELESKVGIPANIAPITQVKLCSYTLVQLATVEPQLVKKQGYGGRDG